MFLVDLKNNIHLESITPSQMVLRARLDQDGECQSRYQQLHDQYSNNG
jgi:hypothetical protein